MYPPRYTNKFTLSECFNSITWDYMYIHTYISTTCILLEGNVTYVFLYNLHSIIYEIVF